MAGFKIRLEHDRQQGKYPEISKRLMTDNYFDSQHPALVEKK